MAWGFIFIFFNSATDFFKNIYRFKLYKYLKFYFLFYLKEYSLLGLIVFVVEAVAVNVS